MSASNGASVAPRILSNACLLFDDLMDQLIDGSNAVAQRNATKHYWERPGEVEKTVRGSEAAESALIRHISDTSRLSTTSFDESMVQRASAKTSSTTTSGDDSRFVVGLSDFEARRNVGCFFFRCQIDPFQQNYAFPTSNGAPSKDTYRTLCSRMEEGGGESERQESLYRSSDTNNSASILAEHLGYRLPSASASSTATDTFTMIPDYRAEPFWREKKCQLMHASKHRH
ncbi:hypothetical protein QR680_005245 [Steinernema hermaphroditum]|uniref:Uncharacterized protein n=1 Tax=Steinernema hermaphroditum TaxID=289476 RepID=A0AA39HSQ5_9BILA|nr:hypothetical protein QR680_005245 [Steinernema hermaphroditum]